MRPKLHLVLPVLQEFHQLEAQEPCLEESLRLDHHRLLEELYRLLQRLEHRKAVSEPHPWRQALEET